MLCAHKIKREKKVDTNAQVVKTSQVCVQHHVFRYTIQHKLKVRDRSLICNCQLALGTKILIVNYACSQTFHHHCSGLITLTASSCLPK